MTGSTTIDVIESVGVLSPVEWDACAGPDNPFVCHAFYKALEESGSATAETGWQGAHLVHRAPDGCPTGLLPGYVKAHSYGEYVFDQNWARAIMQAGGQYYPKLQLSVPFTPATGPRLLLANPDAAKPLIAGAEALCHAHDLSSAHATFLEPAQISDFTEAGWHLRHDIQFHWTNQGYGSYADFLSVLSSRKRKTLRRERAAAVEDGISVVWLRGGEITEAHWDAFWHFYQDTGARKWGRPYLTRSFFSLIGAWMADRILLVLALRDGRPIAGALNFIGSDTLYGRYWGCTEEVPFLHFELCYHQAIDFAVAHGLKRVEAGAQGPHKLARGYLPVITTSAHWIADPRLDQAVRSFLAQERAAMAREVAALMQESPFRSDD